MELYEKRKIHLHVDIKLNSDKAEVNSIFLIKETFKNVPKLWQFEKDEIVLTHQEATLLLKSLSEAIREAEEEVDKIRRKQLVALLEYSEFFNEDDAAMIQEYENALKLSTDSYSVHYKRDLDEIFVNTYNEEWIVAFKGNMDIQLCLDYYSILTYITDYVSKVENGITKAIKEALKRSEEKKLKEKMKIVADTFLTHRQLGASEALYRILPSLHLKESNSDCVFVQTGFPDNRSKFLRKLKEDEQEFPDSLTVEGREGKFVEKQSLLSKYINRCCSDNPAVANLSYAQFCQRYQAQNKIPKEYTFKDDFVQATDLEIATKNYVMTEISPDSPSYRLPLYIKIEIENNVTYMKRRSPYVLRFMKINRLKSPHEYEFSKLLMYRPFKDEQELFPEDRDKCSELFNEDSDSVLKVNKVQSQILCHLEAVENARQRATEIANLSAGEALDPYLEQQNADDIAEGNQEYEKCLRNDFTDFDSEPKQQQNLFRKVDLYDDERLEYLTGTCDFEQRLVINCATTYARSWKKSLKGICKPHSPPLISIQGGAGSGKSTCIDITTQHMEKIFRTEGDDPSCPYILKCAPTGSAASVISGQTLHQCFSFNFGNNFITLGDQKRDSVRNKLKNLKVLIIDEISMVIVDLQYKLHLRLQEITQSKKIFGGIAIFCFGDLMQLKPVMANFIFAKPVNEQFHEKFQSDSLWKRFKAINLKTNHRQGKDKQYGDLLNRIRTSSHTQEDIKLLETRVFDKNSKLLPNEALFVTCLNKKVNEVNEEKLKALKTEQVIIKAKIFSATQRKIKPIVENTGAVRNTPLQNVLNLKSEAKVILTYNIDIQDNLANGSWGTVLGFEKRVDGEIFKIYVEFADEKAGKTLRMRNPHLKTKFPGSLATPISKMEFDYRVSKKSETSSTGTVEQFPLKLAFAATSHKVQGLTVKAPASLIVDLASVREPAQSYVILSRVQELSQIYIVDSLDPCKIYHDSSALDEINRLNSIEIKAMNTTKQDHIILSTINIRSLKKNHKMLLKETKNLSSSIICLQETWLPQSEQGSLLKYSLPGMKLWSMSAGNGKGIATYSNQFHQVETCLSKEQYQISMSKSEDRKVINLYRYSSCGSRQNKELIVDLQCMITKSTEVDDEIFICGDFNFCAKSEDNNVIFITLLEMGFKQLCSFPTHEGGRVIDHVYVRNNAHKYEISQYCVPELDHDIVNVVIVDQ